MEKHHVVGSAPNSGDVKKGRTTPISCAGQQQTPQALVSILQAAARAACVLGSVFYIAGSWCFLPHVLEANPDNGPWLFVAGSILYAFAALASLRRSASPAWHRILVSAEGQNLAGALLFLAGSLVLLHEWGSARRWEVAGDWSAWLFLAGSLAFTLSAAMGWHSLLLPTCILVEGTQIAKSSDPTTAQ